MNYFLDQEFFTRMRKPLFGKPYQHTELISIGIVDETGREFYMISRDFDIKGAWNDHKLEAGPDFGDEPVKNYWLRDNVLIPIFFKLSYDEFYCQNPHDRWMHDGKDVDISAFRENEVWSDNFKEFRRLILKYGQSNNHIAQSIIHYCGGDPCKFWGYYADYDWTLFCSLFGGMMKLPKNFGMICYDLKQRLDELAPAIYQAELERQKSVLTVNAFSFDEILKNVKAMSAYPRQEEEHNAIDDARWNFRLFVFLQKSPRNKNVVRILPAVRQCGNTTRLVDAAIQEIFEGKTFTARDHFMNGQRRRTNTMLMERVMQRIYSEHNDALPLLKIDKNFLTIELKKP